MRNKIIFLIFVMLFMINNVSAINNGSITIDAETSKTFSIPHGNSGLLANFSILYFDTSNYNKFVELNYSDSGIVFPKISNSTIFHIISGGNGSGVVFYWQNSNTIDYICDEPNGCIITSNPITLSFDINIFSGVTQENGGTNGNTVNVNQPSCIKEIWLSEIRCTRGSYITTVSKSFYNNWLVNYFNQNRFNIMIDKSPTTIQTKFYINSVTNSYFIEPTFNTNNFTSPIFTITNGIYLNMTDNNNNFKVVTVNSTSLLPSINTSIIGNITINKNSYNISESILYNGSLSNSDYTNRVKIYKWIDLNNQYVLYTDTNISNGIFNRSYLISNDVDTGHYTIALGYYDNTNSFITLDYKEFNIVSTTSKVNFDEDYYNIGDTIGITIYSTQNGYVRINNTNNVIKTNKTVIANTLTYDSYYLNQNDIAGNWSVNLYDYSGNKLSYDYAFIDDGIIIEPIIIITPSVTQPENFLDIGSQVSEILIGKMTDDSGIVTDVKIQQTGNKIFGLLLSLVILCLIAGTYYTLTNKKR